MRPPSDSTADPDPFFCARRETVYVSLQLGLSNAIQLAEIVHYDAIRDELLAAKVELAAIRVAWLRSQAEAGV